MAELWVSFVDGASIEETETVAEAFTDAGFEADVSDQPYTLVASGIEELPNAFVVITTVAASSFLTTFAAKAGGDAYAALTRLVGRMRSSRAADKGNIEVILRGENSGPDVIIGPDTPDGALGELLTGDLPPAPSGTLVYDRAARRWRDADET